jgi:hypothetical protein
VKLLQVMPAYGEENAAYWHRANETARSETVDNFVAVEISNLNRVQQLSTSF